MSTTHPTRQARERGRLTRLRGRLAPVKVLSAILALCPFAEITSVFRVTLLRDKWLILG